MEEIIVTNSENDPLDNFLQGYIYIIKYSAALFVAYFLAKKLMKMTESAVDDESTLPKRPVLSKSILDELDDTTSNSKENNGDDDEDDDLNKANSTFKRKFKKKNSNIASPKKNMQPDVSPLKTVNPLDDASNDLDERVTWSKLHQVMRSKYKEKHPTHDILGGRQEGVTDDDYDDEMKSLLEEHLNIKK